MGKPKGKRTKKNVKKPLKNKRKSKPKDEEAEEEKQLQDNIPQFDIENDEEIESSSEEESDDDGDDEDAIYFSELLDSNEPDDEINELYNDEDDGSDSDNNKAEENEATDKMLNKMGLSSNSNKSDEPHIKEHDPLYASSMLSKSSDVNMADLIGSVDNEESGSSNILSEESKKDLMKLHRARNNQEDSQKVKPVDDVKAEQISRAVAYDQAKENLEKWQDAIKTVSNQPLQYPLPSSSNVAQEETGPKKGLYKSDQPENDMEQGVMDILQSCGLADSEENQVLNDLEAGHLLDADPDNTDRHKRAKEAAQMRSKMFAQQQKAARVSKIKSKAYRKRRRKLLEQDKEKQRQELREIDPEFAASEFEKRMTARALERITLRHKNTSKWTREAQKRGGQITDSETRSAIGEQMRMEQELRQRMEETGNEVDSEEENDAVHQLETEGRSDLIDSYKQELAQDESEEHKGVFGMKFMKEARQKQRENALNLINEIEDYQEEEDENDNNNSENNNNGDDKEKQKYAKSYSNMASSTGRRKITPEQIKAQEEKERKEEEERQINEVYDTSDDESVDQEQEKAVSKIIQDIGSQHQIDKVGVSAGRRTHVSSLTIDGIDDDNDNNNEDNNNNNNENQMEVISDNENNLNHKKDYSSSSSSEEEEEESSDDEYTNDSNINKKKYMQSSKRKPSQKDEESENDDSSEEEEEESDSEEDEDEDEDDSSEEEEEEGETNFDDRYQVNRTMMARTDAENPWLDKHATHRREQEEEQHPVTNERELEVNMDQALLADDKLGSKKKIKRVKNGEFEEVDEDQIFQEAFTAADDIGNDFDEQNAKFEGGKKSGAEPVDPYDQPGWNSWAGSGIDEMKEKREELMRQRENEMNASEQKNNHNETSDDLSSTTTTTTTTPNQPLKGKRSTQSNVWVNTKFVAEQAYRFREGLRPEFSKTRNKDAQRKPLGPEWNTQTHFDSNVQPLIERKAGHVIEPLSESHQEYLAVVNNRQNRSGASKKKRKSNEAFPYRQVNPKKKRQRT